MAVIQAPNLTNESTAKLIRGSTCFDESVSEHFNRQQNQGDRRCWTWSGWIRMDGLNTGEPAFHGSQSDSNNRTNLYWRTDRCLQFYWKSGGSWGAINTEMTFNDATKWYHVVCAFKSTWGTAESDRVIWYVNGERQDVWTESSGYPALNYESQFNVYNQYAYFGNFDATGQFDGSLCDVRFLDGFKGQASDFGYTDPLTGTWRPKKFRGVNINHWVNGMGAYADLTHDNSMLGKSLTNNNGVTFEAAGANGFGIETAATFVRASDQTFTVVGAFGAYEPATIDFFCKFDNLDNEQYAISLSGTSFGVREDSGTYKWCLHSQDANGTYQGMKYLGAADTNWHHVRIVTYPATNGVWIDGTQQDLGGVYPRGINVTGTTQTIGGQEDGSNEMDGKIAGFRVGLQVMWGPPPTGGFQFHEIQGGYNNHHHGSQAGRYSHEKDVGYNGWYLPLDGTGYSAFQTLGNMVQTHDGRGRVYLLQEGEWRSNDWAVGGSDTPNFTTDSPSGSTGKIDTNAGITTTGFPSTYATWDPKWKHSEITLTGSNLIANGPTAGAARPFGCTFGMTAGKYYWEILSTRPGAANNGGQDIGVATAQYDFDGTTTPGYNAYSWACSGHTGNFTHDSSSVQAAYVSDAFLDGVIIMCALDMDSGKFWMGTNGTWGNNGTGVGDPANGTNPIVSSGLTGVGPIYPCQRTGTDSGANTLVLNPGNTAYAYAAPKGFLPLCSNNNPRGNDGMPNPSQYFKSLLYTGNNTANPGDFNNISCGFQPDMVWVKSRPSTWPHCVFDTVRGKRQVNPGDSFYYWMTDASSSPFQYGSNEHLHSVYGDGFTMFGASGYTNYTGHSFLAMAWKAGGGNIAGSSGDEFWKDGKQYASAALAGVDAGSVNPTASSVGTVPGFSIIKFTGTGSNMTIAHGLSKAPEFVIVKGGYDCMVYHVSRGAGVFSNLNETAAETTRSTTWQHTAPTDTVISLGTDINVNESGTVSMIWCWHSVPGLSAFNQYYGNGDAVGPSVHMGFKPGIILAKKAGGSENWQVHTTAQNPYNDRSDAAGKRVYPNSTATENTQPNYNILGDGFRLKTTDASVNSNDAPYMYACWADEASVAAYGSQATGR